MARLQAVMEQLRPYATTLQERAKILMTTLRELEAAEQAHAEERAEAELRARVGEITEAEWESSSKRAQRELAKIKENQEVVADELNQIREVLGGGEDDDENAPRRSTDFDELEFLKSVVGPAAAAAKPVVEPKQPTPGSSPVARPETPNSSSISKPVTPSTPANVVTAKAPPKPVEPPPRLVLSQAPSDNVLGVTTDEAVEKPRNLKCAECGTMNYASEWYCERCGAELAAI